MVLILMSTKYDLSSVIILVSPITRNEELKWSTVKL